MGYDLASIFFYLIFKKAIYNCMFLFCCICPYFLWWYSQINLIWGQGLWSSWVLVTNLISWSIFAQLCMIVFEKWQHIYGCFQPFHPPGTPHFFHYCPSLQCKFTHILIAHLKIIRLSKSCLLSLYGWNSPHMKKPIMNKTKKFLLWLKLKEPLGLCLLATILQEGYDFERSLHGMV